jgi:DNA mismatch endonuclease (patch repair protein)
MDIWSKDRRSQVMSRILSKNTSIEQRVRKMLSSMGYRYRLHVKGLPGKPDIVLSKYNTVIFVHGCFWHLHSGCRDGTVPKTRIHYWNEKLLKNKKRDAMHIRKLRRQGWNVLRLWECEVEMNPDKVIDKLKKILKN